MYNKSFKPKSHLIDLEAQQSKILKEREETRRLQSQDIWL